MREGTERQRVPRTHLAMAAGSGDGTATLKRCLGVLRDARNDSEQFAALLLVRKRCVAAPSPREQTGGRRNRPLETGNLWCWGLGDKVLQCPGVPVSKVEGARPRLGPAEGWSARPHS